MIHSRIPAFYTEIKLTLFVFGINLGISSGFLIFGYIPTSVFRIRYPVLGAHSALCRAFPRCWMKKRLLYLHPAQARNCSVSCPLGPSGCKWPVTWGEEEIRAWVSSVGKTWFKCKLWKVLQLWMTWVSSNHLQTPEFLFSYWARLNFQMQGLQLVLFFPLQGRI